MKILIIHNSYIERGGEDEVVQAERKMLEAHGHQVILYQRSNRELQNYNIFKKIQFFLRDALWSHQTYRDIQKIIQDQKPVLAHIHNTFLVISPSAYEACWDENVPVIQTIHNYRFLCPAGTFFRKGQVCEKCVISGRKYSFLYRCWRGSFVLSFLLKRIVDQFCQKKILSEKIKAFITLSQFSKNKLIEGGFPEDRIHVKPHFADISTDGRKDFEDHALFVGRLADYKGIDVLLEAFRIMKDYRLKIIGDGPFQDKIRNSLKSMSNVELLGYLPYDRMIEEMRRAAFLIVPSVCYETFGRVVIEAFACGVPVIVSDSGAVKELIEEGITGFCFQSNNPDDLAKKIQFMIDQKSLIKEMRKRVRQEYIDKYMMKENYQRLMGIYEDVLQR